MSDSVSTPPATKNLCGVGEHQGDGSLRDAVVWCGKITTWRDRRSSKASRDADNLKSDGDEGPKALHARDTVTQAHAVTHVRGDSFVVSRLRLCESAAIDAVVDGVVPIARVGSAVTRNPLARTWPRSVCRWRRTDAAGGD